MGSKKEEEREHKLVGGNWCLSSFDLSLFDDAKRMVCFLVIIVNFNNLRLKWLIGKLIGFLRHVSWNVRWKLKVYIPNFNESLNLARMFLSLACKTFENGFRLNIIFFLELRTCEFMYFPSSSYSVYPYIIHLKTSLHIRWTTRRFDN